MSKFEEYANKYKHVKMDRRDGILQFTLHTNGGPVLRSQIDQLFALENVASSFYGLDESLKCFELFACARRAFLRARDGVRGRAGFPLPDSRLF